MTRWIYLWLVILADIGSVRADMLVRTGCFIGPTFIHGVARNACVTENDWPNVMEAPVVDNSGRPIVLLLRGWLSPASDTRVPHRVRRCSEYFTSHIGQPIDVPQQRANDRIFRRACVTAKILFDYGAVPGARVRSFLSRDGSDIAILKDVPASVLELAWLEELKPGGPSLASPIERGELSILDPRLGQQRLKWRDRLFVIFPTARADVDSDGFEDLVIAVTSETLRGEDWRLQFAFLSRKGPGAALEVVLAKLRK